MNESRENAAPVSPPEAGTDNAAAKKSEYGLSAAQLAKLDLISSIAIFCFGLFVFASGVYMCFFTVTGAKAWYYSPGFFPCFVGAILMLASLVMFVKKLRSGASFRKAGAEDEAADEKKRATYRLLLAIALFAVYVFVMIGRLPFLLSTFLYLAVTMIVFRKDNYPIWKLLLISAAATGAVYLFFGVIASVPLP